MSDPPQRDCRFLVCFALEEEARAFRKRLRPQASCQVLITGMGTRKAQESMALLSLVQPKMVLSCGFAGGLNPQWRLGDVVYALDANPDFEKKLIAAGAKPGRFLHTDQVIWKSATKLALWHSSQADVVDMESHIIRQQCHTAAIPCVILRVVSDVATEDLPLDFGYHLSPEGKPHWFRLGRALLKDPSLAKKLMRLRSNSQMASDRLAQVLCSVL